MEFAWCKTHIRFTIVKVQSSPYSYAILILQFINIAYRMRNLANLSQEKKDKINVDLAASGVAYKERLNMLVVDVQLRT